jgi:hypothetical protein
MNRLHKLRTLALTSNALVELPHWIGELAALRELWLQGNPGLKALPEQLDQNKELRRLEVPPRAGEGGVGVERGGGRGAPGRAGVGCWGGAGEQV